MIDGIVGEPTFVLVDGVIHRVWRVSTNRTVCNVDCELGHGIDSVPVHLKPWRPHSEDVPFIQGELCDGPENCVHCIAMKES